MNDTSDWFTVDSIREDTYQITEFEPVIQVNMFVIDGGDEALLIDTGVGIGDLRSLVEDIAGDSIQVLLTHSHWDHVGCAHQFDDVRINDRERAEDGTVRYDFLPGDNENRPRTFVEEYIELGADFPDSFDPKGFDIDPIPDVGTIEPDAEFTVGDKTLETVSLPGHTPGMLGVLDRDEGVFHIADLLEAEGDAFALLIHFESSDYEDFQDSIDRLIDYRDEGAFDMMTQTHGEPIHDLSVLDDARDALARVAEGDVSYETIEHPLGAQRKHHVGRITVSTRD